MNNLKLLNLFSHIFINEDKSIVIDSYKFNLLKLLARELELDNGNPEIIDEINKIKIGDSVKRNDEIVRNIFEYLTKGLELNNPMLVLKSLISDL